MPTFLPNVVIQAGPLGMILDHLRYNLESANGWFSCMKGLKPQTCVTLALAVSWILTKGKLKYLRYS